LRKSESRRRGERVPTNLHLRVKKKLSGKGTLFAGAGRKRHVGGRRLKPYVFQVPTRDPTLELEVPYKKNKKSEQKDGGM